MFENIQKKGGNIKLPPEQRLGLEEVWDFNYIISQFRKRSKKVEYYLLLGVIISEALPEMGKSIGSDPPFWIAIQNLPPYLEPVIATAYSYLP
jgi:hypothetical protein